MKTLLFTAVTAIVFLTISCNKDKGSFNSCEKLSSGLATNDDANVRLAINQDIGTLASDEYSNANLDLLVSKIITQCGITSELSCFNCNHVSPLESEIKMTFTVNGVEKIKYVVIVQTAENKMSFGRVYE